MAKIENTELTEEHIDCLVTYDDGFMPSEVGHITSFTKTSSDIWVKFKSQNGQKCKSENLKWYRENE